MTDNAIQHAKAWVDAPSGERVYLILAPHPLSVRVAHNIADKVMDGQEHAPSIWLRHVGTPRGRIPTISEMLDEVALRGHNPAARAQPGPGDAIESIAGAARSGAAVVQVHDLDEYLAKLDGRDHGIAVRECLRLLELSGEPRLMFTCSRGVGGLIEQLTPKRYGVNGITLETLAVTRKRIMGKTVKP